MIILSAIGRFFKKIWDWIKQTAWIQPLLIVGLIFGIIFSIPAIVNAVKNGKTEKNKYSAYYHHYKLSLDGEANSEADRFTTKLANIMKSGSGEAEYKAFKDEFGSKCGDKFFVTFVSETCDQCKEAKGGFEIFDERFNNKNYSKYASKVNKNEKFNMVTIFTDDENKDTTTKVTAFSKYLDRHQDFFEDAASGIYETPYFLNGKISESALEGFETADETNFYSPTILLVELGKTAKDNKQTAGVTELMFGLDGSDKFKKAETLLDCWNHDNNFSDNTLSE